MPNDHNHRATPSTVHILQRDSLFTLLKFSNMDDEKVLNSLFNVSSKWMSKGKTKITILKNSVECNVIQKEWHIFLKENKNILIHKLIYRL